MNRRAASVTIATVSAVALLAACSSSAPSPTEAKPTKALEVMSWWTSGSEHAALEVLLDDYRSANPDVRLTDGTVAGGAGSNAQVVLASRLQAGDPPDVWQTFVGQSVAQNVSRSRLADVSSVYARDGLSSVIPKVLLDGVTVRGKQYGVSTGAHRSNMLWFNTALLAKAGVRPPTAPYALDTFLADLSALKKAGVTPLCLGGKDRFTAAELLENVLLGRIGASGWSAITKDRFDWGGTQAKAALRTFGTIVDQADPDAGGMTWDAATKKLATGGCAFESMNDSAYGELVADGATEGTDFGGVPFPGTDGQFLAVVDTFVAARQAKNLHNALELLAVIGDKETMLAFNKEKGSVPTRSDVDVSSLSPYQQGAAKALREGTILLSITHGEAMTPQFTEGFYDATESYVRSRDAAAFNRTLQNAVSGNSVPQR